MIDFACKQFNLNEVIKCGLGITKSEFKLLEYLMGNFGKSFDSQELADTLNLDKTTIQRALKKLHEKEVVIRKQKNLEGGGYTFFYEIRKKSELREIIINIVRSWTARVEQAVEQW